MSKLVSLVKSAAIISGTGFAAYYGIEGAEHLVQHFHMPTTHMIPQFVEGYTALLAGTFANTLLRSVLSPRRITSKDAYSIAALSAFANAPNTERNVTTESSLEQISNNLVEIIAGSGTDRKLGSGLMITTDGYVITAHHVVRDAIDNKQGKTVIRTQNGKSYSVKKGNIWYQPNADLAIIKCEKSTDSPAPIRIGVDSECNFNTGDEVRILGFRDGQKYNTLGMITNPDHIWSKASGEKVYNLFQTDARGKQGQSGGVIANGKGELIGIVVYTTSGPNEEIGMVGGAKLSSAIRYINQIAARNSTKMFR